MNNKRIKVIIIVLMIISLFIIFSINVKAQILEEAMTPFVPLEIGRYNINYTGGTNYMDVWQPSNGGILSEKTYNDYGTPYKNSSQATLKKSDLTCEIKYAYLIWESRHKDSPTKSIKFITPSGKVKDVKPDIAVNDIRTGEKGPEATMYSMVTDVTSIVKSEGYGKYGVANILRYKQSVNEVNGGESPGSWQLIVIEEDDSYSVKAIRLEIGSKFHLATDFYMNINLSDFSLKSKSSGKVDGQILLGVNGKGNTLNTTVKTYNKSGSVVKSMTFDQLKEGGLYKNDYNMNTRDECIRIMLKDLNNIGNSVTTIEATAKNPTDWVSECLMGYSVEIAYPDFEGIQKTIVNTADSVSVKGSFTNTSDLSKTGIYDGNLVIILDSNLSVDTSKESYAMVGNKKITPTKIQNNKVTFSGNDVANMMNGDKISYNIECKVKDYKATKFNNKAEFNGYLRSEGTKTRFWIDRLWIANSKSNYSNYIIHYDLNGGTKGQDIPDVRVLTSQSYTISDSKGATKTGYKFAGWGLEDKNNITHQPGNVVSKLSTTHNAKVTFYAIWEPIRYTVNIHQNAPSDYISHGHQVHVASSVQNKYKNENVESSFGSNWTYSNNVWSKTFVYDSTILNNTNEFYSLTGWHTDNNYMWDTGGTNGEVSGTAYPSDQINRYNLTSTDGAVINLYPKWIKNTYYIEYSGNDTEYNIYNDRVTTKFTGSVPKTTCKYDTDVDIAIANTISKPGYKFKEWNTMSNGKGVSYKSGEHLIKPDLVYTQDGTITLYAIWEPLIYDVVFYPESGNIIDWDNTYPQYKINVRFDSIKQIRLPDANKFAHSFAGWVKTKQYVMTNDGKYPNLSNDDFFIKGIYNISVSGNRQLKSEAQIHFNPFTEQLALYAWYNKKPIFVDIYEGLFFEGQSVTYNDLLELIGVYDYEDNYIELQTQVVQDFFNGLIQKIDQDIATDENDIEYLVQEKDLWIFENNPEDDGYDPSELEELDEKLAALRDHLAHLFEQKEGIEKERAYKLGSITDRAKLLNISVAEINYYKTKEEVQIKDDYRVYDTTSLSSSGIYKVKNSIKDNYQNMYLKTRTENIGKFDITYQVSDEGIQFFNTTTGNVEKIPNSDITIEYTRRCQINFNYNPLLYIQGVINDSTVTDIAQSTLKQQAVFDSEDTQDNIPWWNKDTNNINLLLNTEYCDTIQKMQDTIIITGLSNYKFSSAFENEHPDAVQAFKNEFNSPEYSNNAEQHFSNTSLGNYYVPNKGMTQIYDKSGLLDYISDFKGDSSDYHGVTKDQIWRALRGISVTVDAHDQWGKWASNNVSEENYTKPDREVDTGERPDGYIPEYNGGNDLDENDSDDGDDEDKDEYDNKIIQNEEERTTEIILIDDSGDVETIDGSINLTRISSKIRYISNKYLNTLSENSFWGSTGVNTIKEILNKNSVDDTISHSGTYKTETDNTVEVKVKD